MTRRRHAALWGALGCLLMAAELARAQAPDTGVAGIVGHVRSLNEAVAVAGPMLAAILLGAALWHRDREVGRLTAAAKEQEAAHRADLEAQREEHMEDLRLFRAEMRAREAPHQTELTERRTEHLEDLRRFTGETQILAGRIVEERERQSARFARWEQLLEDILDELRGKR